MADKKKAPEKDERPELILDGNEPIEKNIDIVEPLSEEADMIRNMNIYEKIQAVSMQVRNIQKDMTVGSGSYAYKAVSDIDVTLAVKDAEQKYRLVSIPISVECIGSEVVKTIKKNGDEGTTFVDNIKMKIKIVNLDDTKEIEYVESLGKGVDSSDKGFGKASTYARKYGLLNAYKIPTGEDPDANKSEPLSGVAPPNQMRIIIENYLAKNADTEERLLDHFGVSNISELDEKQIKTVYTTYSKKGLI